MSAPSGPKVYAAPTAARCALGLVAVVAVMATTGHEFTARTALFYAVGVLLVEGLRALSNRGAVVQWERKHGGPR